MKTFKTKNAHLIPVGRQILQKEVFLKISQLNIDENGVIPHGFYYIVVNDEPQKLDAIVPSIISWEALATFEPQLSPFTSEKLKDAIYQRCHEFALLKLKMEGDANYGIPPTDWEEYIPPVKTKEEWAEEIAPNFEETE